MGLNPKYWYLYKKGETGDRYIHKEIKVESGVMFHRSRNASDFQQTSRR